MVKNKLISAKIILVLIALLSFGTVVGVTAYSLSLKKSPPIAVQPTQEPTITSTPKLTPTPISDCPGTVNDIDNNIYNTVQIGSQCWLKENLKVTKNPEGGAITRYCYDNDPKICDTDEGLYDWNTAMNNSTKDGSQGICPNGWHVPKDSEWYVLENYLTDPGQTCSDIRDDWKSTEDCKSAAVKLENGGSSGFDAILIGQKSFFDSFAGRSKYTGFWSSTINNYYTCPNNISSLECKVKSSKTNGSYVWARSLNLENSSTPYFVRSPIDKAFGFSLRCLKD